MDAIRIMVNGLPGNMAAAVARHVMADSRFALVPHSLTGPEITESSVTIDGTSIELVPPVDRDARIQAVVERHAPFISVDYTHPSAVNHNAAFYCRHELPFVMGTTGGDRQQLIQTVDASPVPAVIAPNMAKQIVGFQAMMTYAADTFPGLFAGYRLTINESHQQGKADTSGTAKAMVALFNDLGIPFSADQIVKERDPARQRSVWQIPQRHLDGHGWHTYRLVSDDDTVAFEFRHNVNGRDIYAKGTLDAVVFLNRKIEAGASGGVYSMIDVLKG